MDQREHHRRPPRGGAEEVLPEAPGEGRQPQPAQVRVPERQLHRLLVIQAEDRRGFQGDDADRHRLREGPDHHAELLAALDHAEQRLGAAGVNPHGLEPPAQDEADGGEQDVRLVDDGAGRVVGDPACRTTSRRASSDTPWKYSWTFSSGMMSSLMAAPFEFAADVVPEPVVRGRVRNLVEVRDPAKFGKGQGAVQPAGLIEGPVQPCRWRAHASRSGAGCWAAGRTTSCSSYTGRGTSVALSTGC